MLQAGKDAKTIWLATGWEQGQDGKWRSEIDSDQMKLAPQQNSTWQRIGQVVNYPDLFEAYPDIRDLPLKLVIEPTIYTWETSHGAYIRQGNIFGNGHESIEVSASDRATARVMLLHEIQHAIQQREGFAPGSSPLGSSFEQYKWTPGEVEARNAARRTTLTWEGRAQQPPSATQEQAPRFSVAPPVDSPAFKAWFGDSKVVDKDGNPLPVYHGTYGKFTVFNTGMVGDDGKAVWDESHLGESLGVYLTPNKKIARSYGPPMTLYLKAERPLDLYSKEGQDEALRILADTGNISPEDVRKPKSRTAIKHVWMRPDIMHKFLGRHLDASLTMNILVENAKEYGYDSIILPDTDIRGDSIGKTFIAIDPTQIKSATENVGTYDPKNPDIRFSIRDEDIAAEAIRVADHSRDVLLPRFNREMNALAKRLGVRFEAGPPKKAERLAEKVTDARMRKPGVGFEVANDHVRGRIMVNDFSEAPKVLQALQDAGFSLKVGVNTQAWPSGYKGMHAVLELEPGYNGEVQVHTEASWALKEQTDALYNISRTLNTADPAGAARKDAINAEIRRAYQVFWDAIPAESKEAISGWETRSISSSALPESGGPGTQRPSTSSFNPSTVSSQNTRPDSGLRTTVSEDQSGERISEPPGTNIPQDEDKDTPRFAVRREDVLPGLELAEFDPDASRGYAANINLDKMGFTNAEYAEDVIPMFREDVERLAGDIEQQRRGVRHHDQTYKAARLKAMNVTPKMLARIRPGKTMNAEEMAAVEMILIGLAEEVRDAGAIYNATGAANR